MKICVKFKESPMIDLRIENEIKSSNNLVTCNQTPWKETLTPKNQAKKQKGILDLSDDKNDHKLVNINDIEAEIRKDFSNDPLSAYFLLEDRIEGSPHPRQIMFKTRTLKNLSPADLTYLQKLKNLDEPDVRVPIGSAAFYNCKKVVNCGEEVCATFELLTSPADELALLREYCILHRLAVCSRMSHLAPKPFFFSSIGGKHWLIARSQNNSDSPIILFKMHVFITSHQNFTYVKDRELVGGLGKPLASLSVSTIARQILHCFQELHDQNIVHCAFSPEAVSYLTSRNNFQLLRFAYSRPSNLRTDLGVTSVPNTLYSPIHFVDLSHGSPNPLWDLESLVYVLAELELGELPWARLTAPEMDSFKRALWSLVGLKLSGEGQLEKQLRSQHSQLAVFFSSPMATGLDNLMILLCKEHDSRLDYKKLRSLFKIINNESSTGSSTASI